MSEAPRLPSEDEIRARAIQDGLLEAGADLDPATKRRVASVLFAEAKIRREAPAPPSVQLLSRTTYPVPDGVIRVDVLFIPTEKE